MLRHMLLLLLVLFLMLPLNSFAAFDQTPDVTAKSAIVIEASTGKVLYEKDAEQRRYPASTTKIMTLIVALEHGNLEDIVTASATAASTEGSSLWLAQDEQLKLGDLLYGIMLISGNDATVAVAEHISGSLPKFAQLMTEKAHAIGAVSTFFTNSSGLPDPNHYTTAHDLARITAYGYKNPIFTQIVGSKTKIIPWPGKDHDRELFNENRMLWLYDGANGVKTGYTDAAGRCLVSAANRNGVQLITVVLDSDYMWQDSIVLLDYGFKHVSPVKMFNQGDILKTVRVTNGKTGSVKLLLNSSIVAPVSETDKDEFRTEINAPDKIEAPIKAGQKLGSVKLMYKNVEVGSADLVAAESIENKSLVGLVWSSVWNFFTFIVRNFA
ncbi:D-alanyl-D-alanine carboxypeptidase DacB [bioreactor metagenome]|uniref:serine-type D-Ala-D-Ala carboxypeptidase n=1 Tax=bioreactor metagenome TaxID=1076179 RepID=A0A644T0H6_9ZZZZ|nr:D-alanyl-D-alanine carboxypeptidase [Negativicutes bacterium]